MRRWQLISLLLLVAMVAVGLLWELHLAPTGKGYWAVKVLLAVCALPGLWRHRLYTARWLSLALWLYVLEGLVRATSERGAGMGTGLAWAQTALAVALFTTLTLYIRQRLRDGQTVVASAR